MIKLWVSNCITRINGLPKSIEKRVPNSQTSITLTGREMRNQSYPRELYLGEQEELQPLQEGIALYPGTISRAQQDGERGNWPPRPWWYSVAHVRFLPLLIIGCLGYWWLGSHEQPLPTHLRLSSNEESLANHSLLFVLSLTSSL